MRGFIPSISTDDTEQSFPKGWREVIQRQRQRYTIPTISNVALYNMLQTTGITIVDCRNMEEYMTGHLHQALHCPINGRRKKSVNEVLEYANNPLLLRKLQNRDLMEIVVIGTTSTSSLLYKLDVGYKFARMLMEEGRVHSVMFLEEGFLSFTKKYPFLIQQIDTSNTRRSERRPRRRSSIPIALLRSSTPVVPPQHENVTGNGSILQYPSEICEEFLYLGNFWQANNRQVLDALQITHVVNMGALTDRRNKYEHVTYLDIAIQDKENVDIREKFAPVIHFIRQVARIRGRVLIHCVQGVSRSSTFVILYLMLSTRCTLSAAYNFVLQRRPLIFPNQGFMQQLLATEKELYGSESVSIQELDLLQNGLLPPIDRTGSTLRSSDPMSLNSHRNYVAFSALEPWSEYTVFCPTLRAYTCPPVNI